MVAATEREMKNLSNRSAIGFLFAGVLLTSVWVTAAGPGDPTALFPYAGYMEENGQPVNGMVDLEFSLFTQATDGTAAWTEEQLAEPVFGGRFSTALGRNEDLPRSLLQNNGLYLEVGVRPMGSTDPYVVMGTRQRLLSVPFAARGIEADDALRADFSTVAGVAESLEPQSQYTLSASGFDREAITGINADNTGLTAAFGGGGSTVISAGERANLENNGYIPSPSTESLLLHADGAIEFWPGAQGLGSGASPSVVLGTNGRATFRDGVNVETDLRVPMGGSLPTGGDSVPESYLSNGVSCTVGQISVFRPSAQASQDSLCYCGNVDGNVAWVCFNP